MKVYCVQLDIAWEKKPVNYRKVSILVESCEPEPGSLVVLPEMFSTGFSMNVSKTTDTPSGETMEFLASLARQFEVFVAAGIVTSGAERRGRNQAVVLDSAGVELARYTKMQTFSPGGETVHYEAGDSAVVFDWGGFKVSPFVCYDLRFPEHFRAAVHKGATLYLVIANWPDSRAMHWTSLLRARAIENQALVVGVNRCGRDPGLTYSGGTIVIDAAGQTLVEAGDLECVVSCDVDPESVAAYRKRFPFLADAVSR